MKIKKGDTVLVITGKDKGKTGKVEKALPKENKIIVTGINIRKKHVRPSRKYPQGGIIEFPAPLDVSNVMLLCPRCSKPTRVKYRGEKKEKERICAKCGQAIG